MRNTWTMNHLPVLRTCTFLPHPSCMQLSSPRQYIKHSHNCISKCLKLCTCVMGRKTLGECRRPLLPHKSANPRNRTHDPSAPEISDGTTLLYFSCTHCTNQQSMYGKDQSRQIHWAQPYGANANLPTFFTNFKSM